MCVWVKVPVNIARTNKIQFEKTVAWIVLRNKHKVVEGLDWIKCQEFIFAW